MPQFIGALNTEKYLHGLAQNVIDTIFRLNYPNINSLKGYF